MKHPFRSHILPFFTMGAGGLGLVLRLWLFSAVDETGLLPSPHFADSALYILTALVLGILFLATREPRPIRVPKKFQWLSTVCAYAVGALGLLLHTISCFSSGNTRLSMLAILASAVGCITMLCMTALKFARKRLPFWLPAILTVVLMLITVSQCQIWGTEPQLQEYFFPLMASIFLILTAYYKTQLVSKKRKAKLLAFFSQGALFLCCVSLNTTQWPLYFGMLFWAAAQLYPCMRIKKEA